MKNTNLTAKVEVKGLERFKELVEELNNLELEVVVHEVKQEEDWNRWINSSEMNTKERKSCGS